MSPTADGEIHPRARAVEGDKEIFHNRVLPHLGFQRVSDASTLVDKPFRVLRFACSFTHFPNAATDAAIVLRGKCRKPGVSGAMVLVLLCIFMVAGAHSLQCRKFVVLERKRA